MELPAELNRAPAQEVVRYVRAQCSQYGTVRKVSIYGSSLNGDSFAIVEMSSEQENNDVKRALGSGYFAGGIVIPILRA